MKKKIRFINIFDIMLVLLLAASAVLIAVFVAPSGKTVTVGYTLSVSEGDVEDLSEGDALNLISGGCLGRVSKTGDGYIEAIAEAEYHAGRYFSGSAVLKDGEEYVICVGTGRYVCTLQKIAER